MELILIHKIIFILIITIGLWLAFWVYFADRKAKLNKLFFVITILLVLWVSLDYFFYLFVKNPQLSLILCRSVFGVATFWFIPGYYFLVIYFPKESEKRHPIIDKTLVILIAILSLICFFTDLVVKKVEIVEGDPKFFPGQGAIPYYAIILFLIIFYLIALFKKYFKLSDQEKLKVQYVLMGMSLFGLINIIFNVAFPAFQAGRGVSYGYTLFGDYSTIIFLAFTAYAIMKRGLFGIKAILTDLSVGVIGVFLLFLFFFLDTIQARIFALCIFVLFCIVGYLLIRYSHREAKQKEILEQKVKERTKEIEKRKADLEKFYKLLVGRELRMKELKKKIKKMEEKKNQ